MKMKARNTVRCTQRRLLRKRCGRRWTASRLNVSSVAPRRHLLNQPRVRPRHFFSYILPMARPVPLGTRAEISETVEHKHTLTAHFQQLPPVYSTPDMVRLMETACFLAL